MEDELLSNRSLDKITRLVTINASNHVKYNVLCYFTLQGPRDLAVSVNTPLYFLFIMLIHNIYFFKAGTFSDHISADVDNMQLLLYLIAMQVY